MHRRGEITEVVGQMHDLLEPSPAVDSIAVVPAMASPDVVVHLGGHTPHQTFNALEGDGDGAGVFLGERGQSLLGVTNMGDRDPHA